MNALAPRIAAASDELHYLSLTEVSGLIRAGALSSTAVTTAMLTRNLRPDIGGGHCTACRLR